MRLLRIFRSMRSRCIQNTRNKWHYSRKITFYRNLFGRLLADDAINWRDPGLLTQEQKKEISELWADRYRAPVKLSYDFHVFYYKATGHFDAHWVPDDLYYSLLDRRWNNHERAVAFSNKCLYPRLFPAAKMPDTIAFRLQGTWLSAENEALSVLELTTLLSGEREIVFKIAAGSSGGKGVRFLEGDAAAADAVKLSGETKQDIILQRPMRQHAVLSRLYAGSVNTIRHLSYLEDGKAKVYSSILRMGVNGSRVDNASSGGISCGIEETGRLKPIAYGSDGRHYDAHPTTNIPFDTIVIPSFSMSVSAVERFHESFPLFRLISWDIAIDTDGDPVLIEPNLAYGGLDFHQLNNGPLFGTDQDRILAEINWDLPNY